MDSIERWGDDIESAVTLALNELKVGRDEVDVEVLEQPSKGFFGIGSKLAHVKVTKKKAPEAPAPVAEVKVEEKKPVITKDTLEEKAAKVAISDEEASEDKPRESRRDGNRRKNDRQDRGGRRNDRRKDRRDENRKPVEKREFREARDDASDFDSQEALETFDFRKAMGDLPIMEAHPAMDFLQEVFAKMGLNLKMECHADETNVLVDISGDDTRTIIGKRGQTLDAIQYLTSLAVNKNCKEYVKVVVDAENYRSRRQKTLENLAERLAKKVVRSRRSVRLEPMNPYERKVIHSVLQSNPKVTTRSEGQDPYRRVIIELKK